MTVESDYTPLIVACDGIQDDFTFDFRVFSSSELRVVLRRNDGSESDVNLTLNTDFTATAVNFNFQDGGTITTNTVYSSDYSLVIYRDIAIEQLVDIRYNEDLPSESIEDALDRLTLIVQGLDYDQGRYISAPETDPTSIDLELPIYTSRADGILGFDSNGDVAIYGQNTATDHNHDGQYLSTTNSYSLDTHDHDSEYASIGHNHDPNELGWVYDINTIDSDPANGFFRLNNTDASLATMMYLSKTTTNGGDVSSFLATILDGSRVNVGEDSTDDRRVFFDVNGAIIDDVNYIKIPITYKSKSSNDIRDTQICSVDFLNNVVLEADKIIHCKHVLPASTYEGTGVTAGSWFDRMLNTEGFNNITGASLNVTTGAITLPIGTYMVLFGYIPYAESDQTSGRLHNITDNTTTLWSDSSISSDVSTYCSNHLFLTGVFTVAGEPKEFKLQQRVIVSNSDDWAQGYCNYFGGDSIYSSITIKKIG